MMAPNVLLIVFDAARRDALEPYGGPVGGTPTVAQLARRGRALDNVYATAPWTVPSHASMFTGLLPRAAGLSRVPSAEFAKPVVSGLQERLLSVVLGRHGYATAAASANHWISRFTGLDTGFDPFVQIDTDRNGKLGDTSARERLRWYVEAVRARVDDGARAAEQTVDGWLRNADDRPFFWFINLLECHSPYLPPRPYGGVSPLLRLRAAGDARRYYTLEAMMRVCTGVEQVPEEVLERSRRLYQASVTAMDAWLAQILARLDAAGKLDDTVVIVCSDHGENLGENGLIAHGLSLDNRLIHIPFIVAGPGAERLELSSLAHLPRAIAELAGVSEHAWHDGPPQGVGVAQFDPLVTADDEEGAEALRRIGIEGAHYERFVTPLTCAVDADYKLLRRGDVEEAFVLADDPLEMRAVDPAQVPAERLTRLRAALEHPSMVARSEQAADGTPGDLSDEERQELEERMRLLGYL
jgi:arylsulfatase A-like enzyme